MLSVFFAGCGSKTAEMVEEYDRKADGVIIALLDTGVSTEAIGSDNVLPGYNYVTGSDDIQDLISHGTAVASIILGCESAGVTAMAPQAQIVPLVIKTLVDDVETGVDAKGLAKAVRDSVDIYHADIINMSLGIRTDEKELKSAVEYAEENGVLVISAVGNKEDGDSCYYPAAYESVLAVGSMDKHGRKSSFSQDGEDVLAIGENMWLASKNGKKYGSKGTSYACGYATAYAANLLSEDPELSPTDIRESLKIVGKIGLEQGNNS